jgi:hypothetical protein
MEGDAQPNDTSTEAPWQLVRSFERRPQDPTIASHETEDYKDRVLSMRLALVLTPPFRRGKAKLLAKLGERCGVASGKTRTVLINVRTGRIFAGRN